MTRLLLLWGSGLVLFHAWPATGAAPLEASSAPATQVVDTIPREPVPPDTIPGDTIVADTIPEPEVEPRNLPLAPGESPAADRTGVWEWDREGLLATHALTLHDLLNNIPGITLLRGGDFGTPVAVTAFGLGPGQVRVFRDGVEDAPLEGGVVDLSQVGLAGLERVRVERRATELRIHLRSIRLRDARPYTLLDVGTGDLRTNIFRATFGHPSALGGTLLLALDRADTDGTAREEPGSVSGTWFRYGIFPGSGERGGIMLEHRSRSARRPVDVFRPAEVSRRDLSLRTAWSLSESVVGELYAVRSRVEPGGRAEAGADTLLPADARSQVGVRVSGERERVWGSAGLRRHWGDGWPSSVMALELGGHQEELGGAVLSVEREGWDGGGSGRAAHLRAWTRPLYGLSLFGEVGDARRGAPFLVPPSLPAEASSLADASGARVPMGAGSVFQDEEEPPTARFGERRGVRAGVDLARGALRMSGAFVRVEADTLLPLGLPFDRDGTALPAGGPRNGFEFSGSLPLDRILDGLHVHGHGQFWEPAAAWRYLPQNNWAGTLSWHTVGYDTSLEVWFDVGARGRDAMFLPFREADGTTLTSVPSTLSWFGRLQFRVVTVRVFAHWENFTVRDDNRDFPGRFLPHTRAMYGIRWTMWN